MLLIYCRFTLLLSLFWRVHTVYVSNMMNQLMGQGDKELSDLLDFSAVSNVLHIYSICLQQ